MIKSICTLFPNILFDILSNYINSQQKHVAKNQRRRRYAETITGSIMCDNFLL